MWQRVVDSFPVWQRRVAAALALIAFHLIVILCTDDDSGGGGGGGWVLLLLYVHRVVTVCALVCLTRTLLTPPGAIPWEEPWLSGNFSDHIYAHDEAILLRWLDTDNSQMCDEIGSLIHSMPVVERKVRKRSSSSSSRYRYCSTCSLYKPDRCHHDRLHNACVLTMQCHDRVLGRAIGEHNFKYYCLLQVYAFTSAIIASVVVLVALAQQEQSSSSSSSPLYVIALVPPAMVSLALARSLQILYAVVTTNTTMIEMFEEKPPPFGRNLAGVRRFKYGSGSVYKNVCTVFGPLYSWLLPI